jgi:hypothetical protein
VESYLCAAFIQKRRTAGRETPIARTVHYR